MSRACICTHRLIGASAARSDVPRAVGQLAFAGITRTAGAEAAALVANAASTRLGATTIGTRLPRGHELDEGVDICLRWAALSLAAAGVDAVLPATITAAGLEARLFAGLGALQRVTALSLAATGVDAVLPATITAAGLEARLFARQRAHKLSPRVLDVLRR